MLDIISFFQIPLTSFDKRKETQIRSYYLLQNLFLTAINTLTILFRPFHLLKHSLTNKICFLEQHSFCLIGGLLWFFKLCSPNRFLEELFICLILMFGFLDFVSSFIALLLFFSLLLAIGPMRYIMGVTALYKFSYKLQEIFDDWFYLNKCSNCHSNIKILVSYKMSNNIPKSF